MEQATMEESWKDGTRALQATSEDEVREVLVREKELGMS